MQPVTYVKPLRECGIEELAGQQMGAKLLSSGVAFARKVKHEEKDVARQQILDLFIPYYFKKGLSILTMPGLNWIFERSLLNRREGNWHKKDGPKRTYISAIENDRVIYHAALTQMPGLHQEGSCVVTLKAPSFAETNLRNRWIVRYYFGNIDSLMAETDYTYDAVWLDYTGPVSIERLDIIEKFYRERIKKILVITSMRARWDNKTGKEIHLAGDYAKYLLQALPGKLLHQIEYMDTSPMTQIAITKE
jgi:hypothetical protein